MSSPEPRAEVNDAMRLRLICLPDQAAAAVAYLTEVFDVTALSGPYRCRDNRNVRFYLEVQPRWPAASTPSD